MKLLMIFLTLLSIIFVIGMQFVVFPFLLILALGAFGVEIGYWSALAIWLITTFILHLIFK